MTAELAERIGFAILVGAPLLAIAAGCLALTGAGIRSGFRRLRYVFARSPKPRRIVLTVSGPADIPEGAMSGGGGVDVMVMRSSASTAVDTGADDWAPEIDWPLPPRWQPEARAEAEVVELPASRPEPEDVAA